MHWDGLPGQAGIPDADPLWGKQGRKVCHSTHQSPVNICAPNINLEGDKPKQMEKSEETQFSFCGAAKVLGKELKHKISAGTVGTS